MEFEIELFVSEKTGEKMVYISACDGASGAEYPYKTAEDIGNAVATYLDTYYSEAVKTAGWDMTDTEEV